MEESKLEKLKEDYKKIQGKYNLPSFEEMNKDFYIEKIAEVETDLLIREVRKFVADRVFSYLRYIESLLNPVNVPMFVFSITKTLGVKEREKLMEMYKKLSKNEAILMKVDVDFSEEKEAEFIKQSYKLWQEIKREFLDIFNIIESNWDNKFESNSKGYFG